MLTEHRRSAEANDAAICNGVSRLGDHAEEIPVGIGEHDEVGVGGVLPVDSPSAERDQTLDLGLLIGLVVGPQVEVRPVFVVKVEASAGCRARGSQERGVLQLSLVAEGR